MRYALHSSDAPRGQDGVCPLFDAERGCTRFSQRLLRFERASGERGDDDSDELLYVLAGEGRLAVGGHEHRLARGAAAFLARGTRWAVEVDARALETVSVLVHEPRPATAASAVIDLAATGNQPATAGRQFVLGATPEVGCESATQFVGSIPPGRAPDHFHTYDEVIYVLAGEGVLEIGGEQAPLRRGTAVHLPARLVHCLANTGGAEMRVLGVFRPAGSPAEAYYPDGRPALVPTPARA